MATHLSGPIVAGYPGMAAGATGAPSHVFQVYNALPGVLAAQTATERALKFFVAKPSRLLQLRHYAATAGGALNAPRLRVWVNGSVKGAATCPAGATKAKAYTLSGVMTAPANAWWTVGVMTSAAGLATGLPAGLTFAAMYQHGWTL